MGSSAVIPPPPEGFSIQTPGAQGGSIPPPPPGFSVQDPNPDKGSQAFQDEKPGFFGRLGESFGIGQDSTDTGSIVDRLKRVPQRIADVAKSALSLDMEKGIYSNTVDNLKRARQDFSQGQYEKTREDVVRAIPLFGNTLDSVNQDTKTGNISGAAGSLIGVLAQILGPELIKGAKRLPSVPAEAANRLQAGVEGALKGYEKGSSSPNVPVQEAATRQGIDLTPGQANTGTVRFNERLLRGSSESEAARYQAQDRANIEKLKTNLGDIAESFLDKQNLPEGTTSEEAIQHLVDSAGKRAGSVYADEAARIADLGGGSDAPLIENSNSLNIIRELRKKFEPSDSLATVSPERGRLLQELSDAETMFDPEKRLKANPQATDMPLKGDVINAIRDTFRKLPEDTNDLVGARKLLRQGMKADLEESLPPYLREPHNEMLTNYAKAMEAVDSTIGQKIANKGEPELIANLFSKQDFGGNSIQTIKTLIGEDKLPLVHNSFFNNLLAKSVKNGILDGSLIEKGLKEANPQFLKTINPEQLQRVRELAQDAKTLDFQEAPKAKNDINVTPEPKAFEGGLTKGVFRLALGKNSALHVGAETLAKIARDPQGSVLLRKVVKPQASGRGSAINAQRLMFLIHQQELRDGSK